MPGSYKTYKLNKLIAQLYSQTPVIGWKLRRDAIHALARDGSPEAIDALADAVARSEDKQVRRIALKELLTRAAKQQIEAQEALCRLVLETDDPLIREIVLAAAYEPLNLQQRANFYFLTEQWHKYETLDFDQKLLKTAYRVANETVRKRMAECARRTGRAEWATVVASDRQEKRQEQMSDEEWEATLALFSEQQNWEQLWQLVQHAPAVWSVTILLRLKEAHWMPAHESEQAALTTLGQLAEACHQSGLPGDVRYCEAILTAHTTAIADVAIAPDSKLLVSTGGSLRDLPVRVWNLSEKTIFKTFDVWGATRVFITSDGHRLITGGRAIVVWNLPDGPDLETVQPYIPFVVEFLALSPDGQMLAGRTRAEPLSFIVVKDLAAQGDAFRPLSPPASADIQKYTAIINCLAFHPDGQMLASGHSQHIKLWRFQDGLLLNTLEGHPKDVTCMVFTPDGHILASGSQDHTIRLWDITNGNLLKTLEGHTQPVTCLAMSSDGRMLVSGSHDQTTRVWTLPEGNPLQTLTGHTDQITCLALSSDGRILASGSRDKTIRLWTVAFVNFLYRPIGQTTGADLDTLTEMVQSGTMSTTERHWLEFIRALIHWRRRYDIELGEAPYGIPGEEFDIEIGT